VVRLIRFTVPTAILRGSATRGVAGEGSRDPEERLVTSHLLAMHFLAAWLARHAKEKKKKVGTPLSVSKETDELSVNFSIL